MIEKLVCHPAERRTAILDVIHGARRELVLSVFRCDDFKILDALAAAVHRGVHVRALLTPTAKHWDKRLHQLEVYLESMGAAVHRYSGARTKYHAKYIVADDGPALIASLNFTRKCFDKTCDFLIVIADEIMIAALRALFAMDCDSPDSGIPPGIPETLVVGPEWARPRFRELLGSARHRIRIIDHRLSDPEFVALLRERQAAGVSVQVLGAGDVAGLQSHGKLLLVDDETAVIGSISLSPPALNSRREVAAIIRDPANIATLHRFFDSHVTSGGTFNEWSAPPRVTVEDDDEDTD
uniref:phospholipase D n=1 Tax=Solibacter usitatus (strain Ellin6076) TaxID=234267 RepID=Q01ZB3_SOLUE